MPLNPFTLTKGLIERIRNRIREEFGGGTPEDEQPGVTTDMTGGQSPASGYGEIMSRIHQAARTRTLLYMYYNNTWRHVEPYSFRMRSRGQQPLFYGYCQLHNTIEAYRIDRIQDIRNTARPYTPRWSIEIG